MSVGCNRLDRHVQSLNMQGLDLRSKRAGPTHDGDKCAGTYNLIRKLLYDLPVEYRIVPIYIYSPIPL